LSYASILGLFKETGIDDTQYNNLNTVFYVGASLITTVPDFGLILGIGYLVAQWPGHYLMQRLPLGKFITAIVFMWSVIILLHCAASNYGGLIALRFFLGLFESVIVPAMEITLGMFFKPEEQALMQPIFWISCMGTPLPAGFIAYGLLYSKSTTVLPWKFFMIITGSITFSPFHLLLLLLPQQPSCRALPNPRGESSNNPPRSRVFQSVH
jgi:MFS family permease